MTPRTLSLFDIRKDEANDRKRLFNISNERIDGHRSIIPQKSWDVKDYNRAGAFYYQHQTGSGWNDPNPDHALGPSTVYFEEKNLIGEALFEPEKLNPLAEKILGKVDFGTLKMASVGFMDRMSHWGREIDGEDPTILYFDDVVLKEWSIVHIGSNPDAIKKFLEPMDNYMLKQSERHTSEGFRKDFKLMLKKKELDLFI